MGYTIDNVKNVVRFCSHVICDAKDELEQIDGRAGDGDLGISMQKGAMALIAAADSFEDDNISRFFNICAMELNKAAPSTMGTLLCAGFLEMGKKIQSSDKVEDGTILEIPFWFSNAIIARGKAGEGDRTVLDALLPLCRVFEAVKERGGNVEEALNEGKKAAAEGAEKTRTLIPRVGRSKWMPENALGEVDGGAMMCSILVNALAEKYG